MPAQPNQSLIHGLTVLEALAAAEGPVGTLDLARSLGMEQTRVNRLLGTLADLGIAERVAGRKYRPSGGLHVIAALALRGSPLLRAALPEIRTLGDIGRTVALGVRWREYVSYLWFGKPDQPIENGIGGRDLFPADKSSLGILLNRWNSDPVMRERGWVMIRAGMANASLSVPLGDPPYAALATTGPITNEEAPALADRLTEVAKRIADRCAPLHGK